MEQNDFSELIGEFKSDAMQSQENTGDFSM